MSSSGESEYETAEEGDADDEDKERRWNEEDVLQEYGFVLRVSEDGTRWFLPMYYRAELDLVL